MPDSPSNPADVLKLVEENDVRFIRLWFTDVVGQLKSFSINRSELEDAFEGGMGFDGSSITGFNPIEESDMIAMPDPATFAVLPWRAEENATGRMFCDVQTPGGDPVRRRPAVDPAPGRQARGRHGLRCLQHWSRARVLLLQGCAARGRHPGDARRGRILRPHHPRRRLRCPARDHPRPRAAGHPRRVRPPRGRPLPARGGHALQGRARDVGRLHDVPHRRQGVRDEARLARHLHAEAVVRRERLRNACPPVAL